MHVDPEHLVIVKNSNQIKMCLCLRYGSLSEVCMSPMGPIKDFTASSCKHSMASYWKWANWSLAYYAADKQHHICTDSILSIDNLISTFLLAWVRFRWAQLRRDISTVQLLNAPFCSPAVFDGPKPKCLARVQQGTVFVLLPLTVRCQTFDIHVNIPASAYYEAWSRLGHCASNWPLIVFTTYH